MSKQPDSPSLPASDSTVTPVGAEWLASASRFPRSVHALWALRPTSPSVLPCGNAFDVVSTPLLFGRRLFQHLRRTSPGGPVAVHRGRLLVFAAVGTADRLPALLRWEEWQQVAYEHAARAGQPDAAYVTNDAEVGSGPVRPFAWLFCHGAGDSISVPALVPNSGSGGGSRWLVAPRRPDPWLPTAGSLLHATLRALRTRPDHVGVPAGRGPGGSQGSIFTPQEPGARVYDVSRRR